MIKNFINNSINFYTAIVKNILPHLLLLISRLWLAYIFYGGIMYKLADYDRSIAGFTTYYSVPFLSPIFAHYTSLTFEIMGALLLTAGLLTRLATIPMMAIVIGIIFLMPQAGDKFWLLMLLFITSYGGGKISVDYLIYKKFQHFLLKNRTLSLLIK